MPNRPEIFIGGDNSPFIAWPDEGQVTQFLDALPEWQSVRAEVDVTFSPTSVHAMCESGLS
jgi:hypothetical protein